MEPKNTDAATRYGKVAIPRLYAKDPYFRNKESLSHKYLNFNSQPPEKKKG